MNPDSFEYYKYILCYVDNVMYISHNLQKPMKRIQENFKLKDNKIEPPDVYLGATLFKIKCDSGKYCCTIYPEQYVKAAVTSVEEVLARSGKRLLSKCVTLLLRNFSPWLEDSPELMEDGVQQYQELIGQLRWVVDIGRLEILLETSLLSRYLDKPRVGHFKQAFHIFEYLKVHPKMNLGFDPAHPAIDENRFQQCDWAEF